MNDIYRTAFCDFPLNLSLQWNHDRDKNQVISLDHACAI